MEFKTNISKIERTALMISLCLLAPALLINLGLVPFIDDEAIRAIVAMEMMANHEYIFPTIYGEAYLNKPPLYNWFLIFSYKIFGESSEFASRLPTVFFLLCYAFLIFTITKKHLGKKYALIVSLLTVTCGRILFYDALLGLIDVCFSMLMYALMMLIYYYAKQEAWTKMYFTAYVLASLGFMLKNLPAIPFLGISILCVLLYLKKWKKLFHWSHFASFTFALILLGVYYYAYAQKGDVEALFLEIFKQSSKRTVAAHSLKESIFHFFEFPIEFVFDFLPWTILMIYLFKKQSISFIRKNEFLSICVLLLLANIIIYWLSPEVYPRYLFMFLPLVFSVLVALHEHHVQQKSTHYKIIQFLFYCMLGIIAFGAVYSLFAEDLAFIKHKSLIVLFLLISLSITGYFMLQSKKDNITLAIILMLICRIGFNFIVLPAKANNGSGAKAKMNAINLAKASSEGSLALLRGDIMEKTYGYYIMKERNELLKTKASVSKSVDYYLVSPIVEQNCLEIDSFPSRHKKIVYYLHRCRSSKKE